MLFLKSNLIVLYFFLLFSDSIANISILNKWDDGDEESVVQPRIVGGRVADPTRFPYFTGIQVVTDTGSFRCGGVIINSDIVLTAGHCLLDGTTELNAFVNMTSRSDTEGAFRTSLVDWRRHPDFVDKTFRHDVMVGKLAEPVHFNMQYPELNRNIEVPYDEEELKVIGMGVLEESGYFPDDLQVVEINVVNTLTCEDQFPSGIVDGDSQVCAAAPGRDSCQGDSGGPLLVAGRGDGLPDLLTALVSFGSGCAKEGYSSVNQRISYYYEWIWRQACELSADPPQELCIELFGNEFFTLYPTISPSNAPVVTMEPSVGVTPTPSLRPSAILTDSPSPAPSGKSYSVYQTPTLAPLNLTRPPIPPGYYDTIAVTSDAFALSRVPLYYYWISSSIGFLWMSL